MFYTVTATVTTFIKADYGNQAEDILYEALLGNDPRSVLGIAEVHYPVTSVRGVHSTIPVNQDVQNASWAQQDPYQRIINKPVEEEDDMDNIEMQSAMVHAIMADRDRWRDMADRLADAIEDMHHILPQMQAVIGAYLDLCDGDIDG